MKVTSVILALSAIVAMAQATGGLRDVTKSAEAVTSLLNVADLSGTSVKRGLDGTVGTSAVKAKRNILGSNRGVGGVSAPGNVVDELTKGLTGRALSKRATVDVKVILDVVADIVAGIHVQLDAIVQAEVVAKIRKLNVAGLVGVDANVRVEALAYINVLIGRNINQSFRKAIADRVSAHVRGNVNVNVDVIVADVRKMIAARVRAIVVGVDATVMARVCARVKVLNAVTLPVNVYLGLHADILIDNIMVKLDAKLVASVKRALARA
ncbi:hypothetical protein EDD21DRAFT_406305 [Dissophora ornata]|nr:hypothetical protein BGZ58_008814 [Dissophora ornata]KAI8599075.1 hypothetical protein EDD21DRAFT_406305 [Dissophora ornata]